MKLFKSYDIIVLGTGRKEVPLHISEKTVLDSIFVFKMGAAFLPFVVFTVFWGGVGIVLPFFVSKGPNKG